MSISDRDTFPHHCRTLCAFVTLLLTFMVLYFASSDVTAQRVAKPLISGDFSLVDHTGRAVTKDTYRGKWLLVFFGYTHCPDVCPTTLFEIAQVMKALGQEAGEVQPLFITVDPERDTPQVLAQYIAVFHPQIVGLSGTLDQVKAAAQAYRVHYEKVPLKSSKLGYSVDHQAFIYLMRPDGEFETVFPHGIGADAIVAALQRYLN